MIEDRVRADGLLRAGRPVLVMLSGGRYSTALAHVAVRVAGSDSVRALHVNYGLRDAAAEDERACAELCERLGVTLTVERPRRPEGPGNLQAWARDARYGAAIALAGGSDVAAGHTATDQAETILYRLASSPSRRALLGMRARDGALIRPLLAFTREQTAAYCTENGLRWVEDSSNESDEYARNRIRAGLLPALVKVHPAALQNVLAVSEVLRDEAEVLDALVDDALAPGAGSQISLTALRELAPALRRLVVQRLADGAAGGFAPGAGRRADEVAALSEHGVAALDLPFGVRAVAERGVLRFVPTPRAPRTARTAPAGERGTPN